MIQPNPHFNTVVGASPTTRDTVISQSSESESGDDVVQEIQEIHNAVIDTQEAQVEESSRKTVSQRVQELMDYLKGRISEEEHEKEQEERVQQSQQIAEATRSKQEESKKEQHEENTIKKTIEGLVAGVKKLMSREWLDKIKSWVLTILTIAAVIIFAPMIMDLLKYVFGPVWEKRIKPFLDELMPGWMKSVNSALEFIGDVIEKLQEIWNGLADSLSWMFTGIMNVVATLASYIPGVGDAISSAIKKLSANTGRVFNALHVNTAAENEFEEYLNGQHGSTMEEAAKAYDNDTDKLTGTSRQEFLSAVRAYDYAANEQWKRGKDVDLELHDITTTASDGTEVNWGKHRIPQDKFEELLRANQGKTGDYVRPSSFDSYDTFSRENIASAFEEVNTTDAQIAENLRKLEEDRKNRANISATAPATGDEVSFNNAPVAVGDQQLSPLEIASQSAPQEPVMGGNASFVNSPSYTTTIINMNTQGATTE